MTATIALRPRTDWLSRLRTIMVLRGGQRHVALPGVGVDVRSGRNTLHAGGGDWWLSGGAPTPVAVYQPKGAASLAGSYVNLANPGTYDAAPGVAPTFDAATGWTFDGNTQYLTTGVVPTHPMSLILRFADGYTGAQASVTAGCYDGKAFILETGYGGTRYYEYGTAYTGPGTAVASGVMCLTPTQGYLDGVADGTTMSGGTTLPAHALTIGGRNDGGAVNSLWPGSVYACAVYGISLSAAQVTAVSAAMAAL